jgi:outer membrane protein OmpA-like peptidoglycan-associated protein
VEIARFDDEKVIYFLEDAEIVPYLKNAAEAYLPEIFTLEFDCYFEPETYNQRYTIHLYDVKNQKKLREVSSRVWVYSGKIKYDKSEKSYPGVKKSNKSPVPAWRHISLAYTRGKLKVYMDDTRVINIPHLDGTPVGITLGTTSDGDNRFIKNVRLAEGGVKYYDRVLQDGKIIVTGIKFDVNKATLKPESMGPINKIFELMEENPELRFSVEGHTDSEGKEDFNITLSQNRAKAVAQKLTDMGIDNERLTTKGWGETKPMDSNATAEGRANNRRVEFVKF